MDLKIIEPSSEITIARLFWINVSKVSASALVKVTWSNSSDGVTRQKMFSGPIITTIFGHVVWHEESYFPEQGLNLCPLHLEHRMLTTGPPGKSFRGNFFVTCVSHCVCQQQILDSSIPSCIWYMILHPKSRGSRWSQQLGWEE